MGCDQSPAVLAWRFTALWIWLVTRTYRKGRSIVGERTTTRSIVFEYQGNASPPPDATSYIPAWRAAKSTVISSVMTSRNVRIVEITGARSALDRARYLSLSGTLNAAG